MQGKWAISERRPPRPSQCLEVDPLWLDGLDLPVLTRELCVDEVHLSVVPGLAGGPLPLAVRVRVSGARWLCVTRKFPTARGMAGRERLDRELHTSIRCAPQHKAQPPRSRRRPRAPRVCDDN